MTRVGMGRRAADILESSRLRRAAIDSDAWAAMASDDDTARQLRDAAHAARVRADELDGCLPFGLDLADA